MQIARTSRVVLVIGWVVMVPLTVGAWDDLIDQHCVSLGIPKAMVQAIIEVESAGHPFAIGVAIKGIPHSYFMDNEQDATLLLTEFLRVTSNIGIGLMQITWGEWGDKLGVVPTELFDPSLNIQTACRRILKPELDGPGALWERIGRYHSHTAARRDAYGRKVIALMLKTTGAEAPGGS